MHGAQLLVRAQVRQVDLPPMDVSASGVRGRGRDVVASEEVAEDLGRSAVGGRDGGGVDGQGRRGAGVAEALADGADGDAGVEEAGGDLISGGGRGYTDVGTTTIMPTSALCRPKWSLLDLTP